MHPPHWRTALLRGAACVALTAAVSLAGATAANAAGTPSATQASGPVAAQPPASPSLTAETPATLTAPSGTAEIWLDVEGSQASEAISELSSSSAGAWTDRTATATPFGSSAAFPGTAGPHDVRLRLAPGFSAPFTADIAITYADQSGAILTETTVRDASITPGRADSDGWIDWAAIVDASRDGTDDGSQDRDDQTPSSADRASAAHGPLTETGGSSSWWIAAAAAGALALGSAAIVTARRRRSRNEGDAAPPTDPAAEQSPRVNGEDA